MPAYDFKCNYCNVVQEILVPVEASQTTPPCELCGEKTSRVWTPPAIHFKGPGFYKTGG